MNGTRIDMHTDNTVARPVALVTGASRGIGRAIAAALAGEGYDLVLICRERTDLLEALCLELSESCGIRAIPHPCDVSDAEAVAALFAGIPRLDLLVNNAGVAWYGLLQDMRDEDWDRVVGTDISGPFYMCRKAIPLLLRSRGRIINISSIWGSTGASCEAAYSAAKGALNALTRALGKELAPSGIPVNAVACGVVDTDMLSVFDEAEKEALRQEIPADRFCTPEEAAQAVLGLLRMPAYFTGQILTLDGGFT